MSEVTALHKGLRVLKLLRGHTLNGLSNQQLSQASGLPPSAITRTMQALIDEGLVDRGEDGRFRFSIAMLQIASAHAAEMDRAQQRITELNHRIAVGARL
jgi:DNA-binding IclR family transcriptional regulator